MVAVRSDPQKHFICFQISVFFFKTLGKAVPCCFGFMYRTFEKHTACKTNLPLSIFPWFFEFLKNFSRFLEFLVTYAKVHWFVLPLFALVSVQTIKFGISRRLNLWVRSWSIADLNLKSFLLSFQSCNLSKILKGNSQPHSWASKV